MNALVEQYQRKGILPDANLLIGFLVGRIDPRQLRNCRAATRYFGPEDFPLLDQLLNYSDRIVTTPHVLTEVSNLSGRLRDPFRTQFRILLRAVVGKMDEEFEYSKDLSGRDDFLILGLTDAAIGSVSPGRYLVLTDDAALGNLLGRRGVDVINFNHIRTGAWR